MERLARFCLLTFVILATGAVTVNAASVSREEFVEHSPIVTVRELPRQATEKTATNVTCPRRHETPAAVLGEECTPSCTSNSDCEPTEICTCDGDCGLSCVDPGKCRYLPAAPRNGMVIGSKTEEEGMRAVFLCDDGFQLAEGPEWKTCVNGEWSPKEEGPHCVPIPSMVLRRKRKAIKTGGSSVLRSKYGSGGGGGGGRRTFRRKKVQGEGGEMGEDEEGAEMICEELDPLIDVEVIEAGKYDDNDTYSDGAVLK